jgi:heptosyltransferase I
MSAAGDILLCLPAVQALRRHAPQTRVTWLVEEAFADLLRGQPEVDQVAAIPLRAWKALAYKPWHWGALLRRWREFRRELGRERFDLCLDLHGAFRGSLLAALVPCDRRLAIKTRRAKRWRLVLRAERVPQAGPHLVDRGLTVMAALGADPRGPWDAYRVSEADGDVAEGLLRGHDFGCDGPLVALAPATSEPSKCWPQERFALLARRLHDDHRARIVLVGGPGDVALCQRIIAAAGIPALSVAGQTTWPQLAGLLQRCATLVSGDTGPMHLAAAVGRPVVALFGPTVPEVSGPLGEGHVIVQTALPCRPCNPRRACPEVACMAGTTVDQVAAAVAGVLAR